MTDMWTTRPRGNPIYPILDVLIGTSPAMLAPEAVAVWGAQVAIATHHMASVALFANTTARVNLWFFAASKVPYIVPNGHILVSVETLHLLEGWVAALLPLAAGWCPPDPEALAKHPLAAGDRTHPDALACCVGQGLPPLGASPVTDMPLLLLAAFGARMPPRPPLSLSDSAVDYASFFLFLEGRVFRQGVRFRPRPGLCPWAADPNFGRTLLAPLLDTIRSLETLSPASAAESKLVAIGLAWHASVSRRAAPAVLFDSVRAWHARVAKRKRRSVSWWCPTTFQDIVPAFGPDAILGKLGAKYPGQLVHVMRPVRTVCTPGNHQPLLPLWPGVRLDEIARGIAAHLRLQHGGPPPPEPSPPTLVRLAGNLARFIPTSDTILYALRVYARETSQTWRDLAPDDLCWLAFCLHDHLDRFAPKEVAPIFDLFANLGPREWQTGVPYAHFGSCLLDDWRLLQTCCRNRFQAVRLESVFVVTGEEHRSPSATVTQCRVCAAFHEIAADHECPSVVDAGRAWTSPEGLVFWPTPIPRYTVDWDDVIHQDLALSDWDLVLATACRVEPCLRTTPTLSVLRGGTFDPKFAFDSVHKVLVSAMQALWQTHTACQRALASEPGGTLPPLVVVVSDSSNRPRLVSLRNPERVSAAAAAACHAFASWIVPLALRLAQDPEGAPPPVLTTGRLLADAFYSPSFLCGLCCDLVGERAFFGTICGDTSCNAVCDACCRKLFGRFSDLKARVVGALNAACPWCRRPTTPARVQAMVSRKVITHQGHLVAVLRHFAAMADDAWTYAMCSSCEAVAELTRKSCGPPRGFGDYCPDFLCPSCTKASCKSCPTCNVPYQHAGGCLHMHCRLCDTHFCFACLKRFPPPDTGPDPIFCVHAHIMRTHQVGADFDPLLGDQEWNPGNDVSFRQ